MFNDDGDDYYDYDDDDDDIKGGNMVNWLSHTNKCTLIYCTSLKFTLKTFKSSYMFRSSDHLQGAYTVPSWSYM